MKIGKINRQSIGISGFTSVLRHYEGMPKELFIVGPLPKNRPPTVAIVGSRKPTSYGKEVTHKLAYELAKKGVVVVSGLAYGIDAIAHEASLEAGGTTIAVMANGLHRIYPSAHTDLAKRIIAQGGAILSEHPIGYDAHKHDFLARNRIVSGLADAVIVTEATDRSGTFSTVTHALAQNKEVFAVPGPITSLLSAGSNRIIQQGAHVVLSVQDILDVIAPEIPLIQPALPLGDTPQENALIELLQSGVSQGEALLERSNLEASEFAQALTMLELKGVIKALGGNMWSLQ